MSEEKIKKTMDEIRDKLLVDTALVKETFILEEMCGHLEENCDGKLIWSQQVRLRFKKLQEARTEEREKVVNQIFKEIQSVSEILWFVETRLERAGMGAKTGKFIYKPDLDSFIKELKEKYLVKTVEK